MIQNRQSSSARPQFVGVIHLPPLPGSIRAMRKARGAGKAGVELRRQMQQSLTQAVREAKILAGAGFDALIVENFGDVPFVKDEVSVATAASMSLIVQAIRESVNIPLGVNVLRNDALTALSIAAVTGCQFIRVNVLSGVSATDQGWIEGRAPEVLSVREQLDPSIGVLADVWVKHARQFSSDSLSQSIEETALRAGADAIILTGSTTGRLASQEMLTEALEVCESHDIPLYLGSGVSAETLPGLPSSGISGIIVGSDLRRDGRAGAALDPRRVSRWMKVATSQFGRAKPARVNLGHRDAR
ncbi:phosphorybosylanthranilate isomerase [bacterium]|nr:phosphorybosylanthranilate isomerase [bacterium]